MSVFKGSEQWKDNSQNSLYNPSKAEEPNKNEEKKKGGFMSYMKGESKYHRMLWLFIILVCTLILIYQLKQYIHKLNEPPISTESRVLFNSSLTYPAITICHRDGFKQSQMEKFNMGGFNPKDTNTIWDNFPFETNTLTEFWENTTYSRGDTFTGCMLGGDDKQRKENAVKCSSYQPGELIVVEDRFSSKSGRCFTLKPTASNKPPSGEGSGYTLLLKTNPEEYHRGNKLPGAGWDLYIHPQEEMWSDYPSLSGSLQEHVPLNVGEDITLKLTVSEYFTLKHKKDNCIEQQPYSRVKCVQHCLNAALEEQARCRGPWMDGNLPECTNDTMFFQLLKKEVELNRDGLISCNCDRPCNIQHFSTYVVNRSLNPMFNMQHWGRVNLYYPSPAITRIREFWAYDFSQFVGESGGSMGLLLGISVLSIIDIINDLGKYIKKKYDKYKG